MLAPWKKSCDQPRQHIKKQRHYFAYKGSSSQSHGFFSSHVWMWELEHKENWVSKNLRFRTVVLEKTLQRPMDSKENQPVDPKGNQSWIFIGRTDAEAETPIPGHLMQRTDSLEKTLMQGKIEGRRRRDGRRGDGWLTSPSWSTWVLASSGNWGWTGKLGMLQSMGSQRFGHDWVTELNWTEWLNWLISQ